LLLSKPKWREQARNKWVSNQDFIAQNSAKDSWASIQNVSKNHLEPYMEPVIYFRELKAQNKDRDTNATNLYESNGGRVSRALIERKKSILYETTIPKDKTWKERAIQSTSLRQRSHLN
jgi:hypothetical protein